jgi:hypothetical protein
MNPKSDDIQKALDSNADKSDQPLVGCVVWALRDALVRAETAETKLAKIQAKADVYSIPWLDEILEGRR